MITYSIDRFSVSALCSLYKSLTFQSIIILISCFTLFSSPVSAQIEEIIVTAQKREQNVQDVSISITAFTGDMLRDLGVAQPRDLGAIHARVNG